MVVAVTHSRVNSDKNIGLRVDKVLSNTYTFEGCRNPQRLVIQSSFARLYKHQAEKLGVLGSWTLGSYGISPLIRSKLSSTCKDTITKELPDRTLLAKMHRVVGK
jgi:hypothetical protein